MKRLLLTCLLLCQVAAAEPAAPVSLSLHDAVERALVTTKDMKLAREKINEAQGRLEEAWGHLNPRLNFNTRQANQSLNLAALGLSGSSLPIPKYVRPFDVFDSRISVMYNIIDAASRWKVKSQEVGRALAELEVGITGQAVITLTALDYVNLLSARAQLQSTQADLDLAQRLLALAQHQKDQGVAAGIDVTRADTKVKEAELAHVRAEGSVSNATLELARATGLPLDSEISLTEPLFEPIASVITLDAALKTSQATRIELAVDRLHETQLGHEISAEEASTSPTLAIAADYGISGNTPTQNPLATHTATLQLSVPIFDGGVSDGRVAQLESQLKQAEITRADDEIQIEKEVRAAFILLNTARLAVETANASEALSEKEEIMAQDRFQAGLTDSLEVATAQTNLSRAREAQIEALVAYNTALVQLAIAVGSPQVIFDAYHRNPLEPGAPDVRKP